MKTPERKIELMQRRIMQKNRLVTKSLKVRGKYIPAGARKNTKSDNR